MAPPSPGEVEAQLRARLIELNLLTTLIRRLQAQVARCAGWPTETGLVTELARLGPQVDQHWADLLADGQVAQALLVGSLPSALVQPARLRPRLVVASTGARIARVDAQEDAMEREALIREREALIRFLVDKIRGELALSGDAVARSDREGCFHRAAAYAIVLLQLDREQADTWRRQIEEARGVTGGQAGPGGRE